MPPPPLLGYNNNVRHRGRVFHIQTEDSGVGSPRIMTHLFVDGGRIVKSTRTDYSEYLGRDDMAVVVKNMMKEQHKAMFVALRSGELDHLIGFDDDEPVTSAGRLINPLSEAFVLETQTKAGLGQLRNAATALPTSTGAKPLPTEVRSKEPAFSPSSSEPPVVDTGTSAARPYAPSRPASIFSVIPPNSASIFGEVGIDEKSLDDAILSYLAEDEPAATTKK